jgi:hypothetical protein
MTGRGWRRTCVIMASCAMAIGGLAGQAAAGVAGQAAAATAQGPKPPPSSGYHVPATPRQPAHLGHMLPPASAAGPGGKAAQAQRLAMQSAAARAAATGRGVVVSALTTPTMTVTASPGGKFTLDESVLPTRVRRGSGWVSINSALRQVGGGGLSPAAVPTALRLSTGGAGPLAKLGSATWSASLRFPRSLPAPVVSGATADYRNVLPGVDLLVTALDSGGFSETLVVRDAQAAHDPALARMLWPVRVAGAHLEQGPGGRLLGVRGGAEAFSVSNPVMWDSASRHVSRHSALPGPLASSAAGPGIYAHLAVASQALAAGGRGVWLIPARSMLDARTTVFPVFVDPTWLPASNTDIDFDMVQATNPCADTSYYDNQHNYGQDLDLLHVGYYPSSWGACYGTQRTYYDFTLPSSIDHAVIHLATVDAREDYSASCTLKAAVDIHESHGISSTTDWDHQPTWDSTDVSDGDGDTTTDNNGGAPDNANGDASCNGIQDTSGKTYVAYGFTVTKAVSDAANSSPPSSSVTFVLTEDNQDSSGDSFKKFTNNPSLQIQYNFTPNQPTDLKVGDNSANLQDCSGTPRVGASTGGVVLAASFSDKDGDSLNETFRYWIPSKGQSSSSGYSNLPTTGGTATIPRTVYSGLGNGTDIDFYAYAEDPAGLTSPVSGTCVFQAYPTSAVGPGIMQDFTGDPAMGATANFTISPPSGCTATDFRWSLDQVPPVGGGTKVTTNNSAVTVGIIVPSPGAHELYAYADCSNNPNGSDTSGSKFTGAGDQAVSCSSWAAALANTCSVTNEHFDNTMMSGNDGSCGSTVGDGSGHQFDFTQLTKQGWSPNGTLTVDGASFTLPRYGGCATDNILAANQTISMSGQGSALVFLATSSYAQTQVPANGTGDPGAPYVNSVLTAPPVPEGIAVTGDGCSGLTAFDGTTSGCTPAEGTITYTDGSTAPYWLTVPDWWNGPADLAAVTVADADNSSGGQQAVTPKVFAFAVPLNPGKQVASVTLPDVGDTTTATGLTQPLSALHVFGMSVRNTTTATPVQPGAACLPGCATPTGQAWTAAFESPIETGWGASSVSSTTYRVAASPNISAAQGDSVRIRLSDPGFLSGDTDGPIMIGDATIAPQYYQAGAGVAPQKLTFGGLGCVVIPAGGDAYSDPVPLNFAMTAGQNLLVSLYIANGSGQTCGSQAALPAFNYTPGLASPSGASQWTASGDHAGDTVGTAYPNSSWTWSASFLTSVDVTTSATTIQGLPSPGAPTVVVAGNNVTDVFGSNTKLAGDIGAPSFRIAGQLATAIPPGQTTPTGAGFGVVDAGIESNQMQADSTPTGGVSLLARIDHDVLAEPDVGTVIIDEGLQDVLHGASSDAVTSAYGQAYNILYGFGVAVVFATLTPCAGYLGTGSPADACPAGGTIDLARQDGVNIWIGNNAAQTAVQPYRFEADFAQQVETACASPNSAYQCLVGTYDTGDHINLTGGATGGYAQAATAIIEPPFLGDLQPAIPPPAPPPQSP